MSNYLILRSIVLNPWHRPTGKTRHYYGSEPIPPPQGLKIVQISPDPGYYLLYLDGAGNELTDTYHSSLEEALAQANLEFEVNSEEWEKG